MRFPLFERLFQLFQAHRRVEDLEFELVCKEGTVLFVLLSAIIADEHGRFVRSRWTLHDITERKHPDPAQMPTRGSAPTGSSRAGII